MGENICSEKKNEQLNKLIKELAEEDELTSENLELYKKSFEEIYSNEFRHEYSEITRVLFLIDGDEQRDFLAEKIKNISDKFDDGKVKTGINKLWDHINLENIRLAEFRKTNAKIDSSINDFNKTINNLKELSEQAEQTEEKLKDVQNSLNESNSRFITILGIFSGIVMSFSGGLSFIASSLQNINSISRYRLIFVILLLATAIFNIIFMLIYSIGKFTNTTVGKKTSFTCRHRNCKNSIKCAVNRYPIVIWFNYAIFVSLIMTFSMYVVDRYNLITYLLNYGRRYAIITITIALMIFILCIIGFAMNMKKSECDLYNEEEQK